MGNADEVRAVRILVLLSLPCESVIQRRALEVVSERRQWQLELPRVPETIHFLLPLGPRVSQRLVLHVFLFDFPTEQHRGFLGRSLVHFHESVGLRHYAYGFEQLSVQ